MSESTAVESSFIPKPLGTFEVHMYQVDGGMSFGSLMQLCGGLGFTGIILGVIAHFVGQFFWFIIIFPALIGLGVGLVGSGLIKKFRIRNPLICAIAGFAAGVIAMLTMHYMDYRSFNSSIESAVGSEEVAEIRYVATHIDELSRDLENQPEDVQELVNGLKADEQALRLFKIDSFPDFMNYSAEQGVELSGRAGREGANLGYTGSIIYWLVEMLIVAGISFAMMRSAAAEPFCVECHSWKEKAIFGPYRPEYEILSELQSGHLSTLPLRSGDELIQAGDWTLGLWTCPNCQDQVPVDVYVQKVKLGENGEVTHDEIEKLTYPPEAFVPLHVACRSEEKNPVAVLEEKSTEVDSEQSDDDDSGIVQV
ncbi:hypothetical protein [Rubinisphaera italica]|uniref:Uncharacterized protein n=1 Tax=Rubinisphaera italica TaxID=2527969 RepID=A0A5C5XCA3_9PLAN|nr:hypothetical protein [Rubinisphaera italica]TWT60071.1 hypothetical protein Pan54_07840 [Rubinisphaera italica]